jgi:hypothetical protein
VQDGVDVKHSNPTFGKEVAQLLLCAEILTLVAEARRKYGLPGDEQAHLQPAQIANKLSSMSQKSGSKQCESAMGSDENYLEERLGELEVLNARQFSHVSLCRVTRQGRTQRMRSALRDVPSSTGT